jgi:hypothetical protein
VNVMNEKIDIEEEKIDQEEKNQKKSLERLFLIWEKIVLKSLKMEWVWSIKLLKKISAAPLETIFWNSSKNILNLRLSFLDWIKD